MNKKNYNINNSKKVLKRTIDVILSGLTKDSTFVTALEKIYASEKLLLSPKLSLNKRKISSGISDVIAPKEHLKIIINSIRSHTNYRKYSMPSGDVEARESLAILENTKFRYKNIYEANDFCITEGATGGISLTFAYLKKNYPDCEVIIPCPSYYIFKMCAIRNKISFIEVPPTIDIVTGELKISIKAIINSITSKTKMIFITQPNNPTGEIYSYEDISNILLESKKKNVMVFFDELFFDLIMDRYNNHKECDLIASEIKCLKNTLCIKSYSKNRNIPGFRIGYLYSKNNEFMKEIVDMNEERVFSSVGSNFKELIISDSFYQSIYNLLKNTDNYIPRIISTVKGKFFNKNIVIQDDDDLILKKYNNFVKYMDDVIKYYEEIFSIIREIFQSKNINVPDVKTAFNTVIQVEDLKDVNLFDFCLNLYIYYGVKIQVGPYFGFNQKKWENDFGFWFRVSFSTNPLVLKDAILKLFLFKKKYLINKNKFIILNKSFH